ncbi:MAG: copper chaperone PCu(A)C [Gammaproteobacteria bacterium]|nr:copper chaperone PCu(A)C [Gammaproteobacteria bacterium]
MKKSLLLALGLAFSSSALAGASTHVTVADPYVRLSPPSAVATAAYMVLKNNGEAGVRLVKASNPLSRTTELHNHFNDNGVMKMRPVAAIDIEPNGEMALKPGGLHVMMIGLQTPLREGDVIPITLTFDDGSDMLVNATVVRQGVRQAQRQR